MATSIGTAFINVRANTRPAERGIRGFGARIKGNLGRIAKVGGLALGAGIAAGIGGSIKAFADFDAKMTESLAIMGDVSDAMRDEMSDAARDVAKTTSLSAEDAAESYFFLASAGLDAKQSVAALPQVAAFAQAGMFDMARATDLATDAQSALGLASDDAEENLENLTRVTDVFVKANTAANATVEEFSEAITRKAGARIKSMGKDIEEGTAVLAAFADQGIKGAEAGTALDIVFRELEDKALSNADAFEEAGVAVFDSNDKFRNAADIIGDLEGALEGATDKQKAQILSQLGFQARSQSFIKSLLGQSDAIRDYEEELRNAAGTTKDVAENQMETLNAQLGLLKDNVIDLAISIGQRIVPALRGFIQGLLGTGDEADGLAGRFQNFGETVRGVLSGIKGGVEDFIQGFQGIAPEDEETAFTRFGETVRGLLDTFREDVLPILREVWSFITDTLAPAFGELAGKIAGNKPLILGVVSAFATYRTIAFVAGLVRGIAAAFGALKLAMSGLAARGGLLAATRGGIAGVGAASATAAGAAGVGALTVALGVGLGVALHNLIEAHFPEFNRALEDAGAAMFDFAADTAEGKNAVGRALRGIGAAAADFVIDWAGRIDAAIDAFFEFFRGVGRTAEDVRHTVSRIPGIISDALGNLGGLLFDAGSAVIGGLIDGIKSRIPEIISTVNPLGGLIARFKGPLDKDRRLLQPAGQAIMEGLIEGLRAEEGNLIRQLERITGVIEGTEAGSPGIGAGGPEGRRRARRIGERGAPGTSVVHQSITVNESINPLVTARRAGRELGRQAKR